MIFCSSECGGLHYWPSFFSLPSIHTCAIASSWTECTFPSLDFARGHLSCSDQWQCVQECQWASSEPGLKRPHMFLLALLCLCHYTEKNMSQVACSSKLDGQLVQHTCTLSPTVSSTAASAGPSVYHPSPAALQVSAELLPQASPT